MTDDHPRDMVLADLQRGVRMELLVAPVVILLPLAVAAALAWQGWVRGVPELVALAAVVAGGNVVFDLLMIQAILSFMREVRDALNEEFNGEGV